MAVGPRGVHGVLARCLVVTADRSACASVIIPCPNMAGNSVKDPPENSTTVKKMIVQVTCMLCFYHTNSEQSRSGAKGVNAGSLVTT